MTFFSQFTEGVIGDPANKFYRKSKKDGSYRIIGAPNEPMEEIQKRLLGFLRKVAPRCHSAAASRGGLGSVRNARAHSGNEFVFKLDFVNAFGSTDSRRLVEMVSSRVKKFLPRNYAPPNAEKWHTFLSKYVLMRSGGLIQGAKTSPLLLDWYCELTIDQPLRKLLFEETRGEVVYTRYVDDLTFSSYDRITHTLKTKIRKIVSDAGYLENYGKTEVAQLSVHGTVRITGPRIGDEHFGLPRKKIKEMERMLDTQLHSPLFFPEDPKKIEGKLRYLLDVVRGKGKLNALETRTIDMYRQWCLQNGRDAEWPIKVLARKRQKKKSSRARK